MCDRSPMTAFSSITTCAPTLAPSPKRTFLSITAVGCTPGVRADWDVGLKTEMTLVKASDGLAVRTSGLSLEEISLEVMTAEACVSRKKGRYFVFDKNVISP